MVKNIIVIVFAMVLAVNITFADGESKVLLEKQVKEAVTENVASSDALALDVAASLYQIWDSQFNLVRSASVTEGVQYQISYTGNQKIETWKYLYNVDTVLRDMNGYVLNDDKNWPYDLYSRYQFNTNSRSFAFRVEPYDYWNTSSWYVYFWLMAQNIN